MRRVRFNSYEVLYDVSGSYVDQRTMRMAEESTATKDRLAPFFRRLDEMSRLEGNWDTYGGQPPSPVALDAARKLLRSAAARLGSPAGDRVRPFDIAPIPSGGVQLEWRSGERELIVDVGPVGELGYLLTVHTPTGRTYDEGDDASWEKIHDLIAGLLLD